MLTDRREVTEFLGVLEVLVFQGVLEVLVLGFHLFLINLRSKEVLRHSWVLTDLR